ncbi:hypothetical protein Scep_028456 [Stephania cephalantha]|uniref:Uncharacterized protein n=1 Tax=Stephania cephalantha TaxID=152367 RepID=A0AAP0E9Z4_9MAGN
MEGLSHLGVHCTTARTSSDDADGEDLVAATRGRFSTARASSESDDERDGEHDHWRHHENSTLSTKAVTMVKRGVDDGAEIIRCRDFRVWERKDGIERECETSPFLLNVTISILVFTE